MGVIVIVCPELKIVPRVDTIGAGHAQKILRWEDATRIVIRLGEIKFIGQILSPERNIPFPVG